MVFYGHLEQAYSLARCATSARMQAYLIKIEIEILRREQQNVLGGKESVICEMDNVMQYNYALNYIKTTMAKAMNAKR